MADQNSGPLDVSFDTNTTKTAVPMIADGHICRWRLNNVTVSQGDKGKTLVLEWKLVEPAPATDGTTINPGDFGSTFFERIALYAKPDAKDPQWFVKRIAKVQDALMGTGDPDNTAGKPVRPAFGPDLVPQLIGKEIVARMAVRTGDFSGNEFKQMFNPEDVKA